MKGINMENLNNVKNSILLDALNSALKWHKGHKWRFNLSYNKRTAWQFHKNRLETAIKLLENK